MQVETRGPVWLLQQVFHYIQDQLSQRGFTEGPRFGSMVDYVQGDLIVSLEFIEEQEDQGKVRMESEQDLPELSELWDEALIVLGKDVCQHLSSFAVDSRKVSEELKK